MGSRVIDFRFWTVCCLFGLQRKRLCIHFFYFGNRFSFLLSDELTSRSFLSAARVDELVARVHGLILVKRTFLVYFGEQLNELDAFQGALRWHHKFSLWFRQQRHRVKVFTLLIFVRHIRARAFTSRILGVSFPLDLTLPNVHGFTHLIDWFSALLSQLFLDLLLLWHDRQYIVAEDLSFADTCTLKLLARWLDMLHLIDHFNSDSFRSLTGISLDFL